MVRPKKHSFATADEASERLREIATEIEALDKKTRLSHAEQLRWDSLVAESDATFVAKTDLQRAEIQSVLDGKYGMVERGDEDERERGMGPTYMRRGPRNPWDPDTKIEVRDRARYALDRIV